MKKFLNYRAGLFCGGALLGLAFMTIVGCGKATAPLSAGGIPGAQGGYGNGNGINQSPFQACCASSGIQVVSPEGFQACRQVENYQSAYTTASSGGIAPISMRQVFANETIFWSASGTWDTGTSLGACSGQHVDQTSQMISVGQNNSSNILPINQSTVITAPTQLTWEMTSSNNAQCVRNVILKVTFTRCVDINNKTYPCQ